MGHTIWIEAQGRGSETHDDMGMMHQLQPELDVLAEKLGVTTLTTFYDYESLFESYASELEEAGDASPPDPTWSNAEDGLKSVTAIRDQLVNDFDSLMWEQGKSQARLREQLLEELLFCQGVLEQAVADGQQFRLLIVA